MTRGGPLVAALAIVALAATASRADDVDVCHRELWDLDHIGGWQVTWPQRMASAPVLAELRALPARLAADRANLQAGLARGYSVPRSVASRVVRELDALLADGGAVLAAPSRRSHDPAFAAAWTAALADTALPAIAAYRAFLVTDYVPHARTTVGVSALPNGSECYAALLQRVTTLDRTAREVYDLGVRVAAQSDAELAALGRKRYGVTDRKAIIARAIADPDNRFASADELVAFSQHLLEVTRTRSAAQFVALPHQAIRIEPEPAFQRGAGIPSHYEPAPETGAAIFRIATDGWATETRGAAAVTVVHETIPGHHQQVATARELGATGGAFNAAYSEGWANYAERLAEEDGTYPDDHAAIFRRIVLGRSLVVDPGIHAFGWTRERAIAYVMASGLDAQGAADLVDRIAVQPAQLTSYEIGGLEIYRLREAARAALGSRFDLAQFHQRVLEHGPVSLAALDRTIEAWIAGH